MKVLVLSLLVACALGMTRPRSNRDAEWDEWKLEHGKSYVEEEEVKRQTVWQQNRQSVIKHNYEYDLGKHTYRMGMNKFADLTNKEFKSMYLSQMRPKQARARDCKAGMFFIDATDTLPSQVNWTKAGYVTPVKDQKQCGSCWAFSTTGSVEGQHFKSSGQLVSLSEQNLVDCSGPEGDLACFGGLMDYAFEYIIVNKGVDTEESYPYVAMKQTCAFNPANVGATITSCVDLPTEDEMALQQAVATIGPISVAIDASHLSFQLYESGVYYEPQCSETLLDHGVLAVGYGTDNGKDYWLVKNSWGKDWGKMYGFLMMSRNMNNNCGIATNASYPIV